VCQAEFLKSTFDRRVCCENIKYNVERPSLPTGLSKSESLSYLISLLSFPPPHVLPSPRLRVKSKPNQLSSVPRCHKPTPESKLLGLVLTSNVEGALDAL
jgi:hypothetical protein